MADRTFLAFLGDLAGIIAQPIPVWKRELDWFAMRVSYNAPQDPMSLIQAANLSKVYGDQVVFDGVSLAVPHQARVALVGANGAGKTTLLKILIGLELSDSGEVRRARSIRIGHLPQETLDDVTSETAIHPTLWESCLTAFQGLLQDEAELAKLEATMADPALTEKAMERYGGLQEAFERAGGYIYPSRIRQVLTGLGFEPADHDRPVASFSGGERTRARLARLLLEDPDLLLLDEPTNHLDIQAMEWLEGWLKDWPGAAVIVSHDRYFLDHTVDSVWELTPNGVDIYHGNYTAYAHQRGERRQLQLKEYVAQQARVDSEQEYIRRNIAGQNTRQAQGRLKRLERMLRDHTIARPSRDETVRVAFKHPERSGMRVLETVGLQIGRPDSQELLLEVPDTLLERGARVALIGPNGAGKTTLIKTILGEATPLRGECRLGAGLKVGYLAQGDEGFDPQNTVIEELRRADLTMGNRAARDWLARFLFRGDEVNKLVTALSGGERRRLALARLVLTGANLLLLDEPTNHLDLPSQEALQEALSSFEGTFVLVSHDRYLIDALATMMWIVKPEVAALDVRSGGYSEYLASHRLTAPPGQVASQGRPGRGPSGRTGKADRELQVTEERISELEDELAVLTQSLQARSGDVESVRRLGLRYAEVETELDQVLGKWERLARADGHE
jgi:ATP-binding cassette, subfamily F, member 3